MAKDVGHDRRDILAQLVDDAPCGIVVTDSEGRVQYVNATLCRWLDLRSADLRVRLPDLLTAPGRVYYETHMAPMMRLQGFVREISCAFARGGDEPLPVLLSGVARRDALGNLVRFDYTIFDARERRAYEEELRIARRKADELAAIVRSSPNAILRVDDAGRICSWNAGAERLIDGSAESVLGQPVQDTIRLLDRSDWFDKALAAHERTGEAVFEARTEQGHDLEVTVAPIEDHAPSPVSRDWSVVLRDISKQKKAERHLREMVNEMKHRVNNTLTVVSAIARQTLSSAESRRFNARLHSLSKAHDALTRPDNTTGADLRDLLSFAADEAGGIERFRIEGPQVWLTPRQTTYLSMALHELVTNALKYGALSRPDGFVEVSYDWLGPAGATRLDLQWEERNGPPVVPPTRQGFGTKMISRVLAAELSADVDFQYEPSGFRCHIAFDPGGKG